MLSPDEIHKLASKTKKAMTTTQHGSTELAEVSAPSTQDSKLSCHSDYVDPDTAKKKQEEKLVTIGIGLKTNDSVI